MKLDELKKKLYKPESEFEERLELESEKQPKVKINQDWQKIEKKQMSPKKKRNLLIISISVFVLTLGVASFFIYQGFTSFDKNKVELEIKGAERIVSGEEVKYIVKYKNNTRLNLENVKLIFHYPESSIPNNQRDLDEIIDLPDLNAGQGQEVELLARVIGLRGENKKAWAELVYRPKDISSQYTNRAEFESQIISVPLILDFDIPERLVAGQSFDFYLRYVNQAEVSFDDVQIRLEYPNGFVFQSANIDPLEEDNVWSLSRLMAGEQGKILIRGSIEGEQGDVKSFNSQLGLFKDDQFTPYTEAIGAVEISSSPLSVTQTVNNSDNYVASIGEGLNYVINYKNTTDVGIRNVIITSKIQGRAVDLTKIDLKDASFDGDNQLITWTSSNIPDLEYLAPGEEGSVSFSVQVKEPLSINGYNDKNFTVDNLVKIDSSDIPVGLKDIEIAGQSQSVVKISSDLNFQAQGWYYDDLIPNSGPIPPKLGQTTSYTIKWRITNTNNDLENIKVTATLPPHVKWNNRINPGYADLKYNSQTGLVTWTVGDLPAATGILLPVKEVAFQVSITPGIAYLNRLVELIGQSKITGTDSFTGLNLTDTGKSISTDLPDDLNVGEGAGIVIQ